jgi:DNA polymerase I-like protein with 3'-5' exonuclease and polymerase domains
MNVKLTPPERDARKNELVAVDIELFGARKERLHRDDEGTFACVSIAMDDSLYLIEDVHDVHEALKRIRHGVWAIHNATFDLRHLRRWSNINPERVWDTMLVERDIFGGWYDRFSLADLHRRWNKSFLDKETVEEFAVATEMDYDRRYYASLDAYATLEVAKKQILYADEELSGFRWYWDIDHPMIWVVLDMPPVRIDEERWRELTQLSKDKFDTMRDDLPVNPRSPQQVKEYLSQAYKVNVRDTNADTLEGAARKHPKAADFISDVLESRGAGKLVSSYGDNWLEFVEDGYVYPNAIVTGTETGRMAYRNPNMQQIPIRKTPEYREAVIASEGNVVLVTDMNQQEIRCTAFFSKDDRMMEHLANGEDTHLAVTRAIYGDDTIQKEDPRRATGKAINLGISYGLTAPGLARNAGIPKSEAVKILKKYFEMYPGVKRSHDNFIRYATEHYYVTSSVGRRIYINPYTRQWKQNALNAPIQSTAGEQLKFAAVRLRELCKEKGLDFGLVLLVHDEMVLDVNKKDAYLYKELIDKAWKESGDYAIPGIPIVSDIHEGENWRAKQ